jgi:hypothetical protein
MIIARFTIFILLAFIVVPVKSASAQAADTPFQVGAVTDDLTKIDTTVLTTNSGASSTVAFPNQNGAICVNAYAMAPAGTTVAACCTCRIQANGLGQFSVGKELLTGTAQSKPRTAVIKLMASTGTAGTCNASTVNSGGNLLEFGMLAWLHVSSANTSPAFGKTAFTPSTLSAAELGALTTQCGAFAVRACNSSCQ